MACAVVVPVTGRFMAGKERNMGVRGGGGQHRVYIELITEAPTQTRTAYLETFYGLVTRSSSHPPPTLCYSYDQLQCGSS